MDLVIKTRKTPAASVSATENGFHLEIPKGEERKYRLAQIDDYYKLSRKDFFSQPPKTLRLRARVSENSLPGTWGFGLWNDPFGLSFGFGGNPFRLPTFPNAIWFFHASHENYLSFSDKPGNGFLAQVFCSPAKPPILYSLSAIPLLPLLITRKTSIHLRNLIHNIVGEDSVSLEMDCKQWHEFRFDWKQESTTFWVDTKCVLETSISPRPPLGLVIWIDNQFAAWHPDGAVKFGVLKNESAWLEIADLKFN